jgi:hypothetical protein
MQETPHIVTQKSFTCREELKMYKHFLNLQLLGKVQDTFNKISYAIFRVNYGTNCIGEMAISDYFFLT